MPFAILFEGQPIRRFPWVWSNLKPTDRFAYHEDGSLRIGTHDEIIKLRLQQEYCRQVWAEMFEPEWPCEYWERKMETHG